MDRHSARRAFTLIELLVVIVIIAILIAVTLSIAGGVVGAGRERLTRESIRQVDVLIDSYITQEGGVPPAIVQAPNPDGSNPEARYYPMMDGVDLPTASAAEEAGRTVINSLGLFIHEAERVGLGSILSNIPSSRLVVVDGDRAADGERAASATINRQPELRTVLDAWDRPIRFVHPEFDGVITAEVLRGQDRTLNAPGSPVTLVEVNNTLTPREDVLLGPAELPEALTRLQPAQITTRLPIRSVRRNVLTRADRAGWTGGVDPASGRPIPAIGDSDGGQCVNGRPYAYSAGADGDPSTIRADEEPSTGKPADPKAEDRNVYTTEPRFVVPPPAD